MRINVDNKKLAKVIIFICCYLLKFYHIKSITFSRVWGHTLLISRGRQRQADLVEFVASLVYIRSSTSDKVNSRAISQKPEQQKSQILDPPITFPQHWYPGLADHEYDTYSGTESCNPNSLCTVGLLCRNNGKMSTP